MAGEDVRVRLCQQQIIKLDLEVKALIQDIQRCDGPLLELDELNRNVAEKIKEIKAKFDELERVAKEQDKETVRVMLLKELEGYKKQLTSLQSSLRRANLVSQFSMEKKEKEQLLDGGSDVGIRKRPQTNKESLTSSASNITENLINLRRMMASRVEQSEHTMGTLVTSSRQVGETFDEFRNMSGHIQNSRKLLTKYGRRECTDKLLIFLALVFFFASVLYIIKKRLFSSAEDDVIYPNDSVPSA